MSICIITGASSGIGKEFAANVTTYFPNIKEIWLIARRKEKLEEVAKVLTINYKILPLDITKDEHINQLEQLLQQKKPKIKLLINCAGYGIIGNFSNLSLQEQVGMIDLNCTALTKITYLTIPYMKKNSRILQLASVAAFVPQPQFAIYAATKSFVLSFSRALNEELRNKRICVTAVCPGPVKTEFFDIAERYGSTLAIKKRTMVSAKKVVHGALKASLYKRHSYTCSAIMKGMHLCCKLLPHSFVLFVIRIVKNQKGTSTT